MSEYKADLTGAQTDRQTYTHTLTTSPSAPTAPREVAKLRAQMAAEPVAGSPWESKFPFPNLPRTTTLLLAQTLILHRGFLGPKTH